MFQTNTKHTCEQYSYNDQNILQTNTKVEIIYPDEIDTQSNTVEVEGKLFMGWVERRIATARNTFRFSNQQWSKILIWFFTMSFTNNLIFFDNKNQVCIFRSNHIFSRY